MFRHELFRRSFRAEAVIRSARGDSLSSALNHAASDEIRSLVLQSIEETDTVRDLIVNTATLWPLLREAGRGVHGPAAQEAVTEEARRLVDEAIGALASTEVAVEPVEVQEESAAEETGKPVQRFRVEIRQCTQWTEYERGIFTTLGWLASEVPFCAEAARLLRESDAFLAREADRLKIRAAAVLGQAYSPMSIRLPACEVASARTFSIGDHDVDGEGPAAQFWTEPGELCAGELLLGCTLLRGVKGEDAREQLAECVPALLSASCRSGVYHLRLEALRMTEGFAPAQSRDVRDRIVDVLNEFPSNNIFLNSAIVEALCAYGALESPYDADTVANDITEILARPSDPDARERAHGILAGQFEEVISAAVTEALERFGPKDRTMLNAMAALGAPSYAHDGGWYVRELIGASDYRDSELVAEAVAKWAQPPKGDEADLAGRVGGFVAAHVAQARLHLAANSIAASEGSDDALWACWGLLIRHASVADVGSDTAPVQEAWDQLQRFATRAVPQLVWIEQRSGMWGFGENRVRLLDVFRSEVKHFLETGLRGMPLQSPVHAAFDRHDESAAVALLGTVGDAASRRLLTELVDVPEIGSAAVAAIRAIDAKATNSEAKS